MWLAKQATTTSPRASRMMSYSTGPTSRSLPEEPRSSAFVESASSTWTPRSASAPIPWRSVTRPSIGVGSSLKSPVCSSTPLGRSTATATPSGIECVTRWKRIVNGPLVTCEPGVISCRSARSVTPCSSSFPAISARVRRVA